MDIRSEIRRKIRGEVVFPSLRHLYIHRIAHRKESEDERNRTLLRLPVELREEVAELGRTSEYNRIRTAYERGDVWLPIHPRGLHYKTEPLRWVLISGHIWAVEVIRNRTYEMNDVSEDSFQDLVLQAAVICHHRHLLIQYLDPLHPKNQEEVRWYSSRDREARKPVLETSHVDQALEFVLLAILEDESESLLQEPLLERATELSLTGLLFVAAKYRSFRCLQVLLPLIRERNEFIHILTEQALKEDDLELFSPLHDRYSLAGPAAYFHGNGAPREAAKYKAERIFFHYCQRVDYRECVNDILQVARSSRIIQWLLQTFPYEVDWSLLLDCEGDIKGIPLLQALDSDSK